MPLVLALRGAASARPIDRLEHTVELHGPPSAPVLLDELDTLLAARQGASLLPGDLLTVLLPEGDLPQVRALLAPPVDGPHGPARLNGTAELSGADNRLVAGLHERFRPVLELGGALTQPFAFPLGAGAADTAQAVQLALYPAPPGRHGFRVNSVPALTVVFLLLPDALPDAVQGAVQHLLDVHHRGRARVFREEYLDRCGSGLLPDPWTDQTLEDAVELVLDPPGLAQTLSPGLRDGERVTSLFQAAVVATTRLGRQELALAGRATGAAWKVVIHETDLRHATSGLAPEEAEATHWVLYAPCRHYVSQLEECRTHVQELGARSRDLFALVSAMADRALLAKTEAARTGAVVAGVMTVLLGAVGLYAALSAIPLQAERSINPALRAGAIVGALLVCAALLGLLIAAATSSRAASDGVPDLLRRLGGTPEAGSHRRHLVEGVLAAVALALFVLGALVPSDWSLAAATVVTGAAVVVHLRR